ncbi:DUF4870 domain-containing protein [Galbitalea sp. SE-J8]|uniref:DUF4870 domain-containing protein n=1 Tax=Galbitalea sp. SE-J8 TaxID=3054952 RepID=UPI00259CB728|nr:DUF4870 domain-containing protein [Galbitalea sp. SE-J8]MDM4761818.1 DUF4870 domain-containing protein [Galbitalea sp. SE-J8]
MSTPPPPGPSVPPPGGYGAPQPTPPMNPGDERTWATLLHLSPLVVGFWGPLIGYLVLRERGPFIRAHTATALNFTLTMLIAYVAVGILCIPTFGIAAILFLPLVVVDLVFRIVAAMAAYRGQWYSYPATIAFVR